MMMVNMLNRAVIETLEQRKLLAADPAVWISGSGTLILQGTELADDIVVRRGAGLVTHDQLGNVLNRELSPLEKLRDRRGGGDAGVQGGTVEVAATVDGSTRVWVFDAADVKRIYGEGGGGNDRLDIGTTLNLDQTLLGGRGDDVLLGGRGSGTFFGGDGDDALVSRGQNSELDGGDGDDTLSGSHLADLLRGGNGDDDLRGHSGNDTLTGGQGADIFRGGRGIDTADYSRRTDNLVITPDGEDNDGLWGPQDPSDETWAGATTSGQPSVITFMPTSSESSAAAAMTTWMAAPQVVLS
jgi:Ca2+-binding RTX toxin-like protein